MKTQDLLKIASHCDDETLRHLFFQNAEICPDKPAFVFDYGRSSRTYAEFLSEVTAVGRYSYVLGWRGRRVALVGANSYPSILCQTACFCGNVTAACLDHTLGLEEICSRVARCGADVVLYDPASVPNAPEGWLPFSEVVEAALRSRDDAGWSEDHVSQTAPALILFSSGTGGRTKAALLSQQSLCVERFVKQRLTGREHRGLIHLPMYHIIGIGDINGDLQMGNTMYLSVGFSSLLRELQYWKPRCISMVPAQAIFLSELLRGKPYDQGRALLGGALDAIRTAGAPLPDAVVDLMASYDIAITSEYGLTEAAGPVAVSIIKDGRLWRKPGSVGKILEGVGVEIAPVEGSTLGEIVIRGQSVFDGYLGDEAATREVLSEGTLHTGDLGYIDADGYLYIAGRLKNLIILASGENIIPEELEAELLKLEGIRECRVRQQGEQIAADIYTEDEAVARESVRRFNRNSPSFKQIHIVYTRDTPLEKTGSGKIRRA